MKTLPVKPPFSTKTTELLIKADALKTGIITGAKRSVQQLTEGANELKKPFRDNSITSVIKAAEATVVLNARLGIHIPTGN